MTSATFSRAFPLEDIQIRAGGDGRTVEAYAAVFDTPTQIRDAQGTYREQIARTAFAKTINDRGTRFGVFYNHARTLHGTPSETGSVPIGSPVEAPRADGRGLVTVTRYNKTPLADQVLEAIRNGDITGQSFSGRFIGSNPAVPAGGYRALPDGSLPLVTRTEIAMSEYGPTPIPAYDVPMVVGVRSMACRDGSGLYTPTPRQTQIINDLEHAAEVHGLFDQSTGPDGAHYVAPSPFAAEGMVCSNCYLYEGPRACEVVAGDIDPGGVCKLWVIPAELLATPGGVDPTPTDTTPAQEPGRSDTPTEGAVAEAPQPHAARPNLSRLRWEARQKGVLK